MTKNIRDMIYIGMFAIILAICSWISIPMAIPFTLGTFGVFLTMLVLGGKRGTIAVMIYILLGLIGIPVFSGFRGGVGTLLGNTGGYILGYIILAILMWTVEKWARSNKWLQILSMVAGLFACYLCGTIWFLVLYTKNMEHIGIWAVLGWCVFPYVIPDLIKLGLAYMLSKKLKMIVKIK